MKVYNLKISDMLIVLSKALDKGCKFVDIEVLNTPENPNSIHVHPSSTGIIDEKEYDKLKNLNDIYDNLID